MEMEMEMEMEMDSNSSQKNIAKGKRTKRMRLLYPSGVAAAISTSTSSGGSSTTTYESEEEDMANCLILLAQGGESDPHQDMANCVKAEKGTAKLGFYIYECKTCNRTFPSFQALGGHRASHKKPKVAVAVAVAVAAEEKKGAASHSNYDGFEEGNVKSGPVHLGKIHECSICGSEFTSGQALGGHMRRHRASANTNTVEPTTAPPRNILQFDLNLPAPEDDLRDPTAKFQFPPPPPTQVPALVDCHY
ncbi:hypothetical protein VNO78_05761 [Psophocarpus tetragonolobus]|uniref:C2H2-type domain-containing protein n=1 Tax=Psophocarpus tetragonolobus TaxID=3891 RepID=A0AAN9XR02_PSOTE